MVEATVQVQVTVVLRFRLRFGFRQWFGGGIKSWSLTGDEGP